METKEALLELRNKNGLSQEEMAEKVMVTRQAVSRWETGDTVRILIHLNYFKTFGVSINFCLVNRKTVVRYAARHWMITVTVVRWMAL